MHYFKECLLRMSTVHIFTELPAPPMKLFPHVSATFFNLTEERNPLYPGSHHLYALHSFRTPQQFSANKG